MDEYEEYGSGYEVVPPRFRRDGIRPAREEDAEGILYWSYPRQDVRVWQGRIRHGGVFVADEPEDEQNIRGYIYAEAEGEVGHIRELHHERRRGIAALLVKAAKRYAEVSHCTAIEVVTDLYDPDDYTRKPDGSFWTQRGFKQVEEDPTDQEPRPAVERLFRCELDPTTRQRHLRRTRPKRMFDPK